MTVRRVDALFAQELEELLAKSTPYPLSTPRLGNPTLHDFVKGLILSTNIIEVIDKHLPNGYRADWGQVIDVKDGNALSKECDIIIYKGKPYKLIKNRSLQFVLIDKKQTKVVIQVRSSIQSVKRDDKEYCRELKKFAPEVWFIAECCWAKSKSRADAIKRELRKAGYHHFLYLCRMDERTLTKTIEYRPFIDFVKFIKRFR